MDRKSTKRQASLTRNETLARNLRANLRRRKQALRKNEASSKAAKTQ